MIEIIQSSAPGIMVGFAITMPKTPLLPPAGEAWAILIERAISAALLKADLLSHVVPCEENGFTLDKPACAIVHCPIVVTIGIFNVKCLKPGLDLIVSELESLGLLSVSEIAWMDSREGVWRNFLPSEQNAIFKFYEELLIKYMELMAERSKPSNPT